MLGRLCGVGDRGEALEFIDLGIPIYRQKGRRRRRFGPRRRRVIE